MKTCMVAKFENQKTVTCLEHARKFSTAPLFRPQPLIVEFEVKVCGGYEKTAWHTMSSRIVFHDFVFKNL